MTAPTHSTSTTRPKLEGSEVDTLLNYAMLAIHQKGLSFVGEKGQTLYVRTSRNKVATLVRDALRHHGMGGARVIINAYVDRLVRDEHESYKRRASVFTDPKRAAGARMT